MDRAAARAALLAIPGLALVFYGFTRLFDPFLGYGLGLAVYWGAVLVPLIVWRWDRARMLAMARPRWPGWPLALVSAAIVLVVGAAALMAGLPPWPLAGLAVLAALINGTLEEAFWRGTLLPEPSPLPMSIALALLLFVAWHGALLFQTGVQVTGGALALMGGALGLGLVAMALRLKTGGYGSAALLHVAFNFFAFLEFTARNS